jgi:hypothetical protein
VAEDGRKFEPLILNAKGPKITYAGVTGHSYAFVSQAVDGAGNIEAFKAKAEARTKIEGADLIGAWVGKVTQKKAGGDLVTLKGEFKVTNQSPKDATAKGSFVRFYLGKDATLSDSDPILDRDVAFGVLGPGGSVTLKFEDTKEFKAASLKGKYVIAVIDPDQTEPETDFTNNTVAYGPLD